MMKEKPVFLIKIHAREHCSWQGSVTKVGTGESQHFRSALELLKMMEEQIGSLEEDDTDTENVG